MWAQQSQTPPPPVQRMNDERHSHEISVLEDDTQQLSSSVLSSQYNSSQSTRPRIRPRQACDSCNSRKIKCVGDKRPCEPCKTLDLACTFNRPSRRRRPVNNHASTALRRRAMSSSDRVVRAAAVHLESVAPKAPSITHSVPLLIESICDVPTLQILVDDYFKYIHPVIPLPHEPSFRAAFARRDDRVDSGFVALLASMIEVLVASFPRRPFLAFTSEQAKRQYPTAGALIDQCHKTFNEARGIGFTDREASLNDALCSYLAGLAAGYLFDMSRQRRYLSECVVILRTLGFHKPERGSAPDSTTDHIYDQSGRRLFWLCFVGSMSVRQLGGYDSDILMPPTAHTEKLPPLPIEIDDEYIYSSHIFEQPSETVSIIHGFNLNVRLFRSFHSLIALEVLFGTDTVYDWERQRMLVQRALAEVKAVTQNAPTELCLTLPVDSSPQSDWTRTNANTSYSEVRSHNGTTQKDRKAVQFEIQKANIYATQLATRSFLVEKFWNLYEIQARDQLSPFSASVERMMPVNSPTAGCIISGLENRHHQNEETTIDPYMDDGEHVMAVEREDIVRDMALLLKNINQVHMEPNGLSFCNKIRQVASTLLNQGRSRMSVMPSLDSEAVNEYLVGFCNILAKLERLGPERIRDTEEHGRTTRDAEEEALVHWASLKEHQERFIRSEGFLANANI